MDDETSEEIAERLLNSTEDEIRDYYMSRIETKQINGKW